MDSNALRYGVWDTEFNDWDSGPFATVADAHRATYVGMPAGADVSKYKQSRHLQIREWLPRGAPGEVVL